MSPPTVSCSRIKVKLSVREIKYLFVSNNNTAVCCVCKFKFASTKSSNISRHYILKHKTDYDNWSLSDRRKFVETFRKQLASENAPPVTKPPTPQITGSSREALAASYAVSWEIARAKKSFSSAEFARTCAIAMAQSFKNEQAINQFKTIPLSRQTVSRRVVDINNFLVEKLRSLIHSSAYYSLWLDESTDITDVSQLAIFIRVVQSDFSVNEELFALTPLHDTTCGTDIFETWKSVVSKFADFLKCTCVVTDGPSSIIGTGKGLIGCLRKNEVHCPALHCIIHQDVLCSTSLKLSKTMKIVIKIINFVKGGNRTLAYRKLKSFLKEKEAAYNDLLLHTDVKWLSAGKALERFFADRKELLEFFKSIECDTRYDAKSLRVHLENPEFLCALAFLTDMTLHLINLNIDLRAKKHTVADLLQHINSFKLKLNLFQEQLEKETLVHFPRLEEIRAEFPDMKFSSYQENISELLEQFNSRFQDFEKLSSDIQLFANPLQAQIENQNSDLQSELRDLQADPNFSSVKEKGADFFKLLPVEKYSRLRDFGLKMFSFCGLTYIYETSFSALKLIKSSHRSSLRNVNLESALRLAVTKFSFDPQDLMTNAVMSHSSRD